MLLSKEVILFRQEGCFASFQNASAAIEQATDNYI